MRKIIFILILLILAGCSVSYKDISSDDRFVSYIGKEYIFLEDMHLSGVNLPPGYEDTIDVYTISRKSRAWGGPELITRVTLKKGTTIRVIGIYESEYGVLFNGHIASIKIENYEVAERNKLIAIYIEDLDDNNVFKLKRK